MSYIQHPLPATRAIPPPLQHIYSQLGGKLQVLNLDHGGPMHTPIFPSRLDESVCLSVLKNEH